MDFYETEICLQHISKKYIFAEISVICQKFLPISMGLIMVIFSIFANLSHMISGHSEISVRIFCTQGDILTNFNQLQKHFNIC